MLIGAVFTSLESAIAGDGPVIEQKQDNDLVMDITGITGDGSTEVGGENLWRVGMYGSSSPQGRGRKLGYQTQVLSQPQMDQTLETDSDLPFGDTQVNFDMTGLLCKDVKYLCTELRKNRDATPDYTFEAIPNERALVSCTELGDRCKGWYIITIHKYLRQFRYSYCWRARHMGVFKRLIRTSCSYLQPVVFGKRLDAYYPLVLVQDVSHYGGCGCCL